MKIKVQIVEDDPITTQDLKEILTEHQFEVIGTSKTYDHALEVFYSLQPEIVLADIGLKGEKDGIDLVNIINASPASCPVVYLSGNSDMETKSRAFETDPAAFLTKPFNSHTVVASLELALNRFNKQQSSTNQTRDIDLFVKKRDKFYKFNTREIIYLEAQGSYCKIFTTRGEYITSGNLKSFTEKLAPNFIRIHRSFLINQEKVTAIDAQNVYLGEKQIGIGRQFKVETKRLLK